MSTKKKAKKKVKKAAKKKSAKKFKEIPILEILKDAKAVFAPASPPSWGEIWTVPPAPKGVKYVAYKKVYIWDEVNGDIKDSYVLKLYIPTGALVRIPFFPDSKDKLRVSRARVVSARKTIKQSRPKKFSRAKVKEKKFFSGYDRTFTYTIGKVVRPNSFCASTITCAPGIHCFSSEKAALEY